MPGSFGNINDSSGAAFVERDTSTSTSVMKVAEGKSAEYSVVGFDGLLVVYFNPVPAK